MTGLLRELPKLDGFPFPFPKLGPLFGETEEPSSGSPAPAASPPEKGLGMPLFGEGTAGKPLPKILPLFGEKGSGNSMPSVGGLHIGPLGKGVLSEQVQEQIHTRPDGTVCKTTIVVVNGKEKSRALEAVVSSLTFPAFGFPLSISSVSGFPVQGKKGEKPRANCDCSTILNY